MEGDVLDRVGRHGEDGLDDLYSVYILGIANQFAFYQCLFLFHERFHLFLQPGILLDVFADGSFQVGSVVEELTQLVQRVLDGVHHFFHFRSGDCLDTADAGSY